MFHSKNSICWMVLVSIFLGCNSLKKVPVFRQNFDCQYKLFISASSLQKQSNRIIDKNKLENIKLINMAFADTKDNGTLELEKFERLILRLFPDPNATGYGMLDWEGTTSVKMANLSGDDPEFKRVLFEFIKAYNLAKKLRPNIRFGYYGYPLVNYWARDRASDNDKFKPLLSVTDVYFPAIYDYYPDDTPNAGKVLDNTCVSDKSRVALEYAAKFNKSVIPAVYHRWLNEEKKGGMALIPLEEFIPHVKAAFIPEVNGKKIKGIVWWNEDSYFYSKKIKTILKEVGQKRSYPKYEYDVTRSYLEALFNILDEECIGY